MKRIAHRFSSAALFIIVAIGLSLHTSVTASDQSQLKLFGKWTATPTQFNLGDGQGSTALSSKWAVVGAWSAEDRGAVDEGAVQVFNAATGAWVRKLLPPGPAAANQFFGFALALSGDTLIVGAHGTNGGRGAIHLFNLATGALIRSIPNPTGVPAEYFGAAVAISVDFVVAGAYGANTNAGRVDLLDLKTGSRTRSIVASPAVSNALFGSALAIEGNILAVGAQGDNANTGKVYFYSVTLYGYDLIRTLVPSGAAAGTYAGAWLAMFQGRVAIGTNYSGKAFLFDLATEFEHALLPVSPAGDGTYGNSVAINHEYVAVGQRFATSNSGAVHLFNSSGVEEDTILSPGGTTDPQKFGASVCLDGNTLLATAPEESTQGTKVGAAYLIKPLTGLMNYFKVAAKGDFAPGLPHVNLGTTGEAYINRFGKTAFISGLAGAGVSSNANGAFWNYAADSVSRFTATGSEWGGGVTVSRVLRMVLNNTDYPSCQVTLHGSGINSSNNVVMYLGGGAIRTGTSMAGIGLSGTPSAFLDLVQSHAAGSFRLGCPLTLRVGLDGVTLASDSAVFIFNTLGLPEFTLIKEGSPAPASLVGDVALGQLAPRLCYVNSSQYYSAALTGTSVSTGNNAVVLGRTAAGVQSVVARKGDTVVDELGVATAGITYSSFIGEASNDLNTAFYRATITGAPGAGVTTANNEGLWAYDPTFAIRRLMVRKGNSVLEVGSGSRIARIISFWGTANLATIEQAIVLVQLSGSGINASNDQVLLLAQSDNDSVRILMREGDPAQGCPGAKIGVISRVESDPIS
ncbi:MAG: hypothetical protein NTV80_09635, partial [Verrucomicrobia bacterium]|nr:hypothetical protein [Verrucomicrobiota bacterium]